MLSPANERKKKDDEWCACLEFPNEQNKVAVGYVSWFEKKFVTSEEVEEAITQKTLLVIKWPTDSDVLSPYAMQKKIAANEINWSKAVARILAHGGFVLYMFLNF